MKSLTLFHLLTAYANFVTRRWCPTGRRETWWESTQDHRDTAKWSMEMLFDLAYTFRFFFFLTLFSPLLGTLLAEHTPVPSSRRFSRGSYQARDPAKAPLILFSKPCSVFSTTLRYISFILILIMNKKKYIFILFLESDLSIIRISQS